MKKDIDFILSIIAIICGVIGLVIALVIAPHDPRVLATATFEIPCHTDTECGCTDDCLEPQPKE